MRDRLFGHELGAMTVGIIGFGNVGAAVARRLEGFGSRVVFTDVVQKDVKGPAQVDLDTLLGESDLVCIHTPLDVDTRGLIGADVLAKMKEGSFLVNAARGPIVDEGALIDALRSGHLGGAALDVFEIEPLSPDSPLRALDNVVLSPHVGGYTREAEVSLEEFVGENLVRALDGLPPMSVVNGVEASAKAVR
jgi:D-3-phosphoglycerate dehydrogenase